MMRSDVVGMIAGWLVLGIWSAPALADGGSVRLRGKKCGYEVTVFTAPTPFRAGAVDISVLVLDASTGSPVTPGKVTVRMTKPGRLALEYPATPEAATNKLFRAAQFALPEPGRWALEVEVQGSQGLAVIGGELDAAEPLPRWRELWPWIGWPALAIVVFGIHQFLARRTRMTGFSTTANDAARLFRRPARVGFDAGPEQSHEHTYL
jgi:hypothetical protein